MRVLLDECVPRALRNDIAGRKTPPMLIGIATASPFLSKLDGD
jgi:hypothetical protein